MNLGRFLGLCLVACLTRLHRFIMADAGVQLGVRVVKGSDGPAVLTSWGTAVR